MNRKVLQSIVFVLGLMSISLIHFSYVRDIRRENKMSLQYTAAILADRLSTKIKTINNAVETLAAFITSENELPDHDEFNHYASEVINEYPTLLSLQFVSFDGVIVYEFPHSREESVLHLDLKQLEDWTYLQKARRLRKTVVGPNPGVLVQGSQGIIIRTPLYRNDTFLGWVQGVYRIEDLLYGTERQLPFRPLVQLVANEGTVVIGSATLPKVFISRLVLVHDQIWELKVASSVQVRKASFIIALSIWGGGLLLLMTILWNLRASWRKKEELNTAVHERTVQLKETMQELRDLTIRSAKTEEETRKRIAAEIHDDLGPRLTGIGLAIDSTLKHLAPSKPILKEALQEARYELNRITESTRDIVDGLRPPNLDDFGVSAAIRWHTKRIARRTGMQINLKISDIEYRFPAEVEIGLFRILQEALNNVIRHAQANKVTIELMEKEGGIFLRVSDNGAGFDLARHTEIPTRTHGLISMRERAFAIGGQLTLVSQPGEGTVVEVRLGYPL